ncbi:MAG TPA: hypothetical protein VF177_06135 [Anaerolineae bacterium]
MSEESKWQALLVTVREGTQNDIEAFYNLAYLMAEEMRFPLAADWLGQPVTVTGIDLTYSSHSHGLKVNTSEQDEPLAIEEIIFLDADDPSTEWIGFYLYWRDLTT